MQAVRGDCFTYMSTAAVQCLVCLKDLCPVQRAPPLVCPFSSCAMYLPYHAPTMTQVADGLYVSGEAVARDRSVLAQNSITHVVNCVGALYPEYFKNDGIQYKTLWLQGEATGTQVTLQVGSSRLVVGSNIICQHWGAAAAETPPAGALQGAHRIVCKTPTHRRNPTGSSCAAVLHSQSGYRVAASDRIS